MTDKGSTSLTDQGRSTDRSLPPCATSATTDGIVTLTLDDPTASANTMTELYRDSMSAAVRRLDDEVDDVTGSDRRQRQEDLLRWRQPGADAPDEAGGRAVAVREHRGDQARPAPAGDLPATCGRRDQRCRARWGLRDRAGLQPPDRRRRPLRPGRAARGDPRSAPGRRWRDPHRPDARPAGGADGRAAPGREVQAGRCAGQGSGRRGRGDPRRPADGGEGVDPRAPR